MKLMEKWGRLCLFLLTLTALSVPALAAGLTEDGAPRDWTEEEMAASQEARDAFGETDSSGEPAPLEDAMTDAEEAESLEAPRAARMLTIGDTVNGTIANTGDIHTYEFRLSASGRVTLNVTSYMRYYSLALYNAEGTRIWYDDFNEYNAGSGMRTDRHEIDLEAGTYDLRVGGSIYVSGGSSSTGNYTIRTSFTASGANETEPNDSVGTANEISLGDTIQGQIATVDGEDCDFYQFTLSASGRVTLNVTSYMRYYTLELYNAEGTRIWYDDFNEYNAGSGMRTDRHEIDLEAGTYDLRVGGSIYVSGGSSSTGNYTIRTSFTASGANETEPNGSVGTANEIPAGNVIHGQIATADGTDYDFYRLIPEPSGHVTLDVTSYMRYYTLELYNAEGTRIWYDDFNEYNAGSGMRTDRHEIDLEAGTYYLRVGGSIYVSGGSSSTGNYTIELDGVANAHTSPGYQVDRIVIRDSEGEVLNAIPTRKFLASVSMTNVAPGKETMVLLSAYSARGEYMGLMYARAKGLRQNGTLEVTLPVDNTPGNITQLKAFAIVSFNDLRPLGSAISFPV